MLSHGEWPNLPSKIGKVLPARVVLEDELLVGKPDIRHFEGGPERWVIGFQLIPG